jgi:hypothetical protein
MLSASRLPVDHAFSAFFFHSASSRPKLRIGILVDGDLIPAFARRVLEDIAACDFADVVVYVRNMSAPAPAGKQRSMIRRLLGALSGPSPLRGVGYRAYRHWLDNPRRPQPDPQRIVSCADMMRGIQLIDVTPIQTVHVDRFSDADAALVHSCELDVLLRFGFRILRGAVLDAARYGIWSFHHGDGEQYRGGPPYIWELIEGNPISGATLQVLEDNLDRGPVLAKGLFASSPSLSVSNNAYAPYWATTHFVVRSLHALHSNGPTAFDARVRRPGPYEGKRLIYRTPSNATVARWLIPQVARRVVRRLTERSHRVHWRIALRRTQIPLYEHASPEALAAFHWFESPPGRFWADPFLIRRDGALWVFFEDFDHGNGRAVLACARITDAGHLEAPRTVLDRPYHLSYPHVFSHDGEVFMVPESMQAGTIDLFRATRFPDEWTLECTLLKLRAVDSTLCLHDGQWWMISSPMTVNGHAALTYVWRAPRLTGPWQLTADTPLSNDVRRARGAGQLFRRGQELWRPCQDCSRRYGRALAFNRVEQLADAPAETTVQVIEAGWQHAMVGTHTYNAADDWEVIDGQFLEP